MSDNLYYVRLYGLVASLPRLIVLGEDDQQQGLVVASLPRLIVLGEDDQQQGLVVAYSWHPIPLIPNNPENFFPLLFLQIPSIL